MSSFTLQLLLLTKLGVVSIAEGEGKYEVLQAWAGHRLAHELQAFQRHEEEVLIPFSIFYILFYI